MKKLKVRKVDAIWGELIKKRDNYKCVYCGKESRLNPHHIFSRSKRSTRWYLPNGITLCSGCHTLSSTFSAHKTPFFFREWIKKLKGDKWYNDLMLRANTYIEKRPLKEIKEELEK